MTEILVVDQSLSQRVEHGIVGSSGGAASRNLPATWRPFVEPKLDVLVLEIRHPLHVLVPCLQLEFDAVRNTARLVGQRLVGRHELLRRLIDVPARASLEMFPP